MANHHVKTAPAAKLAFIIGLALLALTVFILLNSLKNTIEKNSVKGDLDVVAMAENKATISAVNLQPVGEVRVSDGSGAAPSAARSGEEVYKAVCASCHATGAAGAPKTDDKAAWEPRVANGFDALLKTAIEGKGAMPARAGQNISDEELTSSIAYMTEKAGFSLDIPKAEAPAAEKLAEAATPEAKPAESAPAEAVATPEAKPAEPAPAEAVATPEAKPEEPAPAEAAATPEAKPAEPAPAEATATPEAKPAEPAPAEAATPEEKPTAPAPEEKPAAPAPETKPATPEAEEKPAAPAPEEKPAAPAPAEKAAASANTIDGQAIYKTACFTCHDMGVANAPKLTDPAAWQARIATGKEVLYNTAINGKGAMPPKGGQMQLSDDEIKAVVDYMVSTVEKGQ